LCFDGPTHPHLDIEAYERRTDYGTWHIIQPGPECTVQMYAYTFLIG